MVVTPSPKDSHNLVDLPWLFLDLPTMSTTRRPDFLPFEACLVNPTHPRLCLRIAGHFLRRDLTWKFHVLDSFFDLPSHHTDVEILPPPPAHKLLYDSLLKHLTFSEVLQINAKLALMSSRVKLVAKRHVNCFRWKCW